MPCVEGSAARHLIFCGRERVKGHQKISKRRKKALEGSEWSGEIRKGFEPKNYEKDSTGHESPKPYYEYQ